MTTRSCITCHETKPIDDFEKRADRPLGRGYRCRECMRARTAKYYREHADERRQYARELAASKPARKRDNGARSREYRLRFPEKNAAHVAVAMAVAAGTIFRPAVCEECGGAQDLHGHHDDYARPLDVVWLCRGCHMRRHRSLLPPRTP